jgi:hypothetical protein
MLGTCSQMLRLENKATQRMLNVKVLRPTKHYIPLRDNDFRTKIAKDIPSSKQHINKERNIWDVKDNSTVIYYHQIIFILLLRKNKNNNKLQKYLRLERR